MGGGGALFRFARRAPPETARHICGFVVSSAFSYSLATPQMSLKCAGAASIPFAAPYARKWRLRRHGGDRALELGKIIVVVYANRLGRLKCIPACASITRARSPCTFGDGGGRGANGVVVFTATAGAPRHTLVHQDCANLYHGRSAGCGFVLFPDCMWFARLAVPK